MVQGGCSHPRGKIRKIGSLRAEAAEERIDARGLYVSPGFIDIHCHSDTMPGRRLGLADRGRIEENMWADMAIFDPAAVGDRATYADPRQYPAGIPYVLVNGQLAVREGRWTRALPGKVLRKGRPS